MHRIFYLEIPLLGNHPTDIDIYIYITNQHVINEMYNYIEFPPHYLVIAEDWKQSNIHQCETG